MLRPEIRLGPPAVGRSEGDSQCKTSDVPPAPPSEHVHVVTAYSVELSSAPDGPPRPSAGTATVAACARRPPSISPAVCWRAPCSTASATRARTALRSDPVTLCPRVGSPRSRRLLWGACATRPPRRYLFAQSHALAGEGAPPAHRLQPSAWSQTAQCPRHTRPCSEWTTRPRASETGLTRARLTLPSPRETSAWPQPSISCDLVVGGSGHRTTPLQSFGRRAP